MLIEVFSDANKPAEPSTGERIQNVSKWLDAAPLDVVLPGAATVVDEAISGITALGGGAIDTGNKLLEGDIKGAARKGIGTLGYTGGRILPFAEYLEITGIFSAAAEGEAMATKAFDAVFGEEDKAKIGKDEPDVGQGQPAGVKQGGPAFGGLN